MNGLRSLEVYLSMHFDQWSQRMDSEQEMILFEPLLLVRQAKQFVVHVSWVRPQLAFEREDMPFQIMNDASLGR